jgi:hypothetical protein
VVLPAVLIHVGDLTSIVGGLAAAIAVGAFIGQSLTSFGPAPSAGDAAIPLWVACSV